MVDLGPAQHEGEPDVPARLGSGAEDGYAVDAFADGEEDGAG